MKKIECKDFKSPDEVRTFEKGKVELVTIGDGTVGLLTLEAGWRWSEHVKPIAQTKLCEVPHFHYQLSGRLGVTMRDGTSLETVAGQVSYLPSGHDAWVIGNEPVILVDWSGAMHYAKQG